MGSFPDCDEILTRNDIRRWDQQAWKGVHNLQLFDLNGIQFLFELPSREIAEHIMIGEWKRQGIGLKLEWWLPTSRQGVLFTHLGRSAGEIQKGKG